MRLLEGELHNSDNILYCYSQVDSLTIPIPEQLLKKKKLMRYKCGIYNLYFSLTRKENTSTTQFQGMSESRDVF